MRNLKRIKQAAMSLPYVEVRRSTGGGGIHLYVYFDEAGVPTANHTEHAALARCILGMMSSETGFDFASADRRLRRQYVDLAPEDDRTRTRA